MIIEGNGKTKEYSTEKVIKYDSTDNEIYVIDVLNGEVEILSQTDFSLKAKGSIDKDFLFPNIANGKLQYTCPVRKDGKIIDYTIMSEQ